MSLSEVVLLRHGETDWNVAQRFQGQLDVPLNDLGRAQAAAASRSIAAMRPDVVVASDLSRAADTARLVAEPAGLAVALDSRLRETHLGVWQGMVRDEVELSWPVEWANWRTTSAHHAPPGGESRWVVAERATAVVRELDATAAERALLVSHGGLIVGLTGLLLRLPHESWGSLAGVANCHWTVLHRVGDRWRLHAYNAGLGSVVSPGTDADEVAGT